jgi:hypothetical protein
MPKGICYGLLWCRRPSERIPLASSQGQDRGKRVPAPTVLPESFCLGPRAGRNNDMRPQTVAMSCPNTSAHPGVLIHVSTSRGSGPGDPASQGAGDQGSREPQTHAQDPGPGNPGTMDPGDLGPRAQGPRTRGGRWVDPEPPLVQRNNGGKINLQPAARFARTVERIYCGCPR